MLVCGLLVIGIRNPVASALFLVMLFVFLAGLFVLLEAFFIAAIQVLVYAGAIMVLFLFVIMLLDIKASERRKFRALGVVWRNRGGRDVRVGTGDHPLPTATARGRRWRRTERRSGAGRQTAVCQLHVALRGDGVAAVGGDDRRGFAFQEGTQMTGGITLNDYLLVSGLLFALGIAGVIIRRNALVIYMALEMNLNAANLALVAFSKFNKLVEGQILVFFIIAIAAAEVAVGLAIIVALYRRKQTISVDQLTTMRL